MTLPPGDYELRIVKFNGSAVADPRGEARFTSEPETRAVWIAVDEATRGYTVAAPHGMLLREIDLPGRGWSDNPAQVLRRLTFNRYSIDVFVIRPGVGMWSGNFRDGGSTDDDRKLNGETDADLTTLKPVADEPPLERIEPRDIVFLVDRTTLEFHAATRGK